MAARKLTSATEDYLEAILSLVHEKGFARVRDIARQLGVSRSAVSNALHALGKRGLVVYEPYRMVTLTDKGRHAAQAVRHRHAELRLFITDILGLEEDIANAAACRIEHSIDAAVLARLTNLADFIRIGRTTNDRPWLEAFVEFCDARDRAARSAADQPDETGPAEALPRGEQPALRSLADVPVGGTAKIVHVGGQAKIGQRLSDMGLTAGAVVSVVNVGALGEPLEVTVRGYRLSLRKKQAQAIYVREL